MSRHRHFLQPSRVRKPRVMHWQAHRGRLSFERSGVVLPAVKRRLTPSTILIHWEQTMSIFGKIMGAIFGTKADAAPAGGGAAGSGGSTTGSGGSTAGSSSAPAAPAQTVDVAPILDKAVAAKKEKLEWRTSIVDLMKALDIDSSLGARKELAKELGYSGDTNDSASMNIWMHKQVMAKLAANGGKLPPEIKH